LSNAVVSWMGYSICIRTASPVKHYTTEEMDVTKVSKWTRPKKLEEW